MAIELVPLDPSHLEEAARLFGAAFRDDPVMLAMLRGLDADERERCLRGFFAASLSACLKRGIPREIRDENHMVAVLLLYPPAGYPPPLAERAKLFCKSLWHVGLLRRVTPVVAKRMLVIWNEMSQVHPKQKHYYGEFMAVMPGYQGKGVGSLFAQTLLERSDQRQVGCYLETTNPRTVPLYERLGFHAVCEKEILGVRMWFMWRDPKPQQSAQTAG